MSDAEDSTVYAVPADELHTLLNLAAEMAIELGKPEEIGVVKQWYADTGIEPIMGYDRTKLPPPRSSSLT